MPDPKRGPRSCSYCHCVAVGINHNTTIRKMLNMFPYVVATQEVVAISAFISVTPS